jgi:hypothetical protein
MRNKCFLALCGVIMCLLFTINVFAIPHGHHITITQESQNVRPGGKFTLRIALQVVNDKDMSGTAKISTEGLEFIDASILAGNGNTTKSSIEIIEGKEQAGNILEFACNYTYKVSADYMGIPSICVDGSEISIDCSENSESKKYFGVQIKTISIFQDTHEHNFVADESTRVPATCGEDGSVNLVCNCGAAETKTLPKTNEHVYGDPIIAVQPSCESQGEQKRYCTVCQNELTEEIDTVAHDYSGEVEEIIKSCTEKIEKRTYCVYGCGLYSKEDIDPPGHDLKEQIFFADCENPKQIVRTCSRCEYQEANFEGEALGHKWNPEKLPENYNCAKGGIRIMTCLVCQKTKEENIAPKGHTPDMQFIVIEKPTCTEGGYSGVFCTVCDAEIVEDRIYFPAAGHMFTIWNQPENADCIKGYVESSQCDNCNEISARVVKPGEHRYGGWYDIVMPLCNKEGSKTRKCSVCTHEDIAIIPKATYHIYKEETLKIESTCTEKGYILKTCQDCGKQKKETLALKDHDWLEPFDVVKSTCTKDGSYKTKCSQCGEIITRVKKASGHSLEPEETMQEHGCEQDGVYISVCRVCNEEIKRIEKATGHFYPEWKMIKEATCKESGLKEGVCSNCNKKTRRVIEKGDKHHKMSIMNEIQKADCGHERIYEWICEICGLANRFTSSPVGEHKFSEWDISAEPSCLKEGEKKRLCEVCNQEEIKTLKPAGHKFSRWKTDTGATCVSEGIYKRSCEVCGLYETKAIEINPKGHSFDEWIYTLAPACEQQGEQMRICGLCAYTETRIAKAKGHSFLRWKTDYASTCDQEGEAKRSCKVCGAEETRAIPISENRHKFNAWKETLAPSCGLEGSESRNCEDCGFIQTKSIKALSHRYEPWSKINYEDCTKGGMQSRKCKNCGIFETRLTEAKNHNYSRWENGKESSCTQTGEKYRTCKRCGHVEHESISVKGHKPGRYKTIKKAEAFSPGIQQRICKKCGHVLEEREYMLSKEAMAVTFSPLGIPLIELLPERTEQWYMIVPIDITKPNEIKLPIVADNKYKIGEIVVSVTDKDISEKVIYADANTEELNILLHFYSSLDELTPKRIKYRYKGLDMDKPTLLSKFAGKEVVIMYLRIEGVYDSRLASDNAFDIQEYEDDILKMYELLDKIV